MFNRLMLPPLFVGIISIVSGLWVGTQLRIQRCLDANGTWDPVRRACALPEGSDATVTQLTLVPYALGGAVTLAFAFLLLRMWVAIQRKNARQRGGA